MRLVSEDQVRPQWRWAPLLVKVAFWLLGLAATATTAIIVTVAGWMVVLFFDIRAKVNTIDSVIDSRITLKVEEVKKDIASEYKKDHDEIGEIRESAELEKVMGELMCQGDYEFVLKQYTLSIESMKPKEIHHLWRASIYKSLINAVIGSSKFSYFKEDELIKMEDAVRKETTMCGAGYMYHMATIYAANGHFARAKGALLSAIDIASGDRAVKADREIIGSYYAMFLLIELAKPSSDQAEDKAKQAWEQLRALENRAYVKTDAIGIYYKSGALDTITQQLSLQSGAAFRSSLKAMESRLEKFDFIQVEDIEMVPPGIPKKVTKIVEIPKQAPPRIKDIKDEKPRTPLTPNC